MGENLHDDIDKIFHDSIEPLSEQPGKHVWENIEQQLDRNNAETYKRKYIFFKRIAAILLFLLLSFATFNLFDNKTKNETIKGNFETRKETLSGNLQSKDSSEDKANAATNNQLRSVNIPSLFGQNRKKNLLKERLIVRINGGTAEQDIGENKADLSNSTGLVYGAIKDYQHGNNIFSLEMIQHLGARITDTPSTHSNYRTEKYKKHNKVSQHFDISAYAAPEFANYVLDDDQRTNYENRLVIQKREQHLLSYSVGLLVGYNLSTKIRLQSGLTLSSSKININPEKIYAVNDNSGNVKFKYTTSSGYGYILPSFNSSPSIGDSLIAKTSTHNLQFVSIPVLAQYKLSRKKFSLSPGVGIVFNFLTKAILKTEVNDDMNSENEILTKLNGLKKFNYNFLLSSELQYQVSKSWSVTATPYFKFALNPINNGNAVETYPYNLGLGVGIMRKF